MNKLLTPGSKSGWLIALAVLFMVVQGRSSWAAGNRQTARWCIEHLGAGADRGACISQGAVGGGPYYTCGPGGTGAGLCGQTCCGTGEVCVNGACANPCAGKPDGTNCDVGDWPTLICVSGTCSECTANVSASPRFVDNGDGTVTDRQTCLLWEKKDDAGAIHDKDNFYEWTATPGGTAPDGSAFTVFLAELNNTGFAGHHDWRLPLKEQLWDIFDYSAPGCSSNSLTVCVYPAFNQNCGGPSGGFYGGSGGNPGCTIDGANGTAQCSCTESFHYWSGSSDPSDPSKAWYAAYYFGGHLFEENKTVSDMARAVRGGPWP